MVCSAILGINCMSKVCNFTRRSRVKLLTLRMQLIPKLHYKPCCYIYKIFGILRLITKFTKILCHENLELYGITCLDFSKPLLNCQCCFKLWVRGKYTLKHFSCIMLELTNKKSTETGIKKFFQICRDGMP